MSIAQKRSVNYFQNALKGIACILVILNHFHHSNIFVGGIEYTLSHVGVPIFYLISGYYLYSGDPVCEYDKLKRRIIHSLKLLAIFMLVSLGYQAMISIIRFHSLNHLIQFVSDRCTLNNVIRSIFLSETLFGRGEWFLWAMLEAYILLLGLHTFLRDIIRKCSKNLAIALFCVHVIVRWILITNGISQVGGINLYATYCVRNVWFDALPFILLGYDMHKNNRSSYRR